MKKALNGLVAILLCQVSFCQTTQAGILVSPYYRYFLPQKSSNEPCRILDTVTYRNERIVLFTKDRAHQFGVKTETLEKGAPRQVNSTIVQTIERRPFTARSSIFDDGLIFEYWDRPLTNGTSEVLFGYTTDHNVSQVRIRSKNGVRLLKLYDGRYFFCIFDPAKVLVEEAQGLGVDGKVLRVWNDHSNYGARRTWLSFFVQTYPYAVHGSYVCSS